MRTIAINCPCCPHGAVVRTRRRGTNSRELHRRLARHMLDRHAEAVLAIEVAAYAIASIGDIHGQ